VLDPTAAGCFSSGFGFPRGNPERPPPPPEASALAAAARGPSRPPGEAAGAAGATGATGPILLRITYYCPIVKVFVVIQ
jgi:hypothetical protein